MRRLGAPPTAAACGLVLAAALGRGASALSRGRADIALGDDEAACSVQLLQQDARLFTRPVVADDGQGSDAALVPVSTQTGGAATRAAPTEGTNATLVRRTATWSGMKANAEGDLEAFITALCTNVGSLVVCVVVFMVLRVRYPEIYSNNVLKKVAPSSPDISGFFSWVHASLRATTAERIASIGLDNAMLLEYSLFAMKVCAIVGLPTCLVLGPLNALFGGHEAGGDNLSMFSFGNIHRGSPLYWLHAFGVWGVVLTIVKLVWQAQERFIHMRWVWLRGMPDIRANTVLVEGIPPEYQSAKKLREFFEVLFPGDKVKDTYCVRDTSVLRETLYALDEAKKALFEAETTESLNPGDPPLTVRTSLFGPRLEAKEYWRGVVDALEPRAAALRKEINDLSEEPGPKGYHCPSGFITFHSRRDAEVALRLNLISSDMLEWVVDTPPEPTDIFWADLMQGIAMQTGRAAIGYALVVGLYFAYVPLSVGITSIAQLINMGPLQPLWAGIAPTIGLSFMMSFLPTFIIWIFKLFFTLKAEAWAQLRLQRWYFWFQLIFVVMASAVGQNIREFHNTLVQRPFAIFGVLADTLPFSTHFYMNFIVLQWLTHAMNLLRYVNLSKFTTLSLIYDKESARAMSEPEDQDYYGLGSRSARWSIHLAIGIVYGTLCPPMYPLVFLNFAVCRLFYGYLIPFAETRKPDLGGVFWVTQLTHVFHGLVLYTLLMTGVLARRAETYGPCFVAAPSVVFVLLAMRRFQTHFAWERLPFHELMSDAGKALGKLATKRETKGLYLQEELLDPTP